MSNKGARNVVWFQAREFRDSNGMARYIPLVIRGSRDETVTDCLKKQLYKIKQCADGYGRLVLVEESCYGSEYRLFTCANCWYYLHNKDCMNVEFEGKEIIYFPKRTKSRSRSSIKSCLRFKVLKRDNFTCQYCGRSSPDVELHIDHKIPVSMGGSDDIENLITACAECNIGKSDSFVGDGASG